MHVGQAVVAALELECELFVVDAELVQDRRVQVVDVDRIADDVVAVVVGLTVRDARLDAAAGHPDCEAARVMIAAVVRGGQVALAVDGAAELAAPDDERVVEQPAPLQVENQSRTRLVDVARLIRHLRGKVRVLIPAHVEELDEPHAALGQPSREEAVRRERARLFRVGSVQIEDVRWLARHVGQLGDRGLHPKSQLVLSDPRGDLGIAGPCELQAVQLALIVEHVATQGRVDPRRIRQIEHGVSAAAQLHALMDRRQEAAPPQAVIQRLVVRAAGPARHHRDERGEIFVFRTESIRQPRTEAGPSSKLCSRGEKRHRRIVIDRLGRKRLDEAQFVGHSRQMREQFADGRAALPVPRELEHRRHDGKFFLARRHPRQPLSLPNRLGQVGAAPLLQLGLVIEQFELRGGSRLKQVDHPLGLRREAHRASTSLVGEERVQRRQPEGTTNTAQKSSARAVIERSERRSCHQHSPEASRLKPARRARAEHPIHAKPSLARRAGFEMHFTCLQTHQG